MNVGVGTWLVFSLGFKLSDHGNTNGVHSQHDLEYYFLWRLEAPSGIDTVWCSADNARLNDNVLSSTDCRISLRVVTSPLRRHDSNQNLV